MSKKEILAKLFSLQRFGIKPGLERTLNILGDRGNPHRDFPSVHVAGTNGKGTVCSFIASILQESGLKVGQYTSPHLVDFNERIRINGEMISDEDLVAMATEYLPYSEKFGGTFFEITTAMAFEYFAKKKVDIAIIETGLGGRFDSTNVLTPLVSIITSIDYDHTEYLGDTIEKIAFEKAGIIKQNVPLVLSQNAPEVREVIKNRFDRVNGIEDDFYYSRIDPNHKKYFVRSPLLGRHVKENLSVVISALDFLRNTYTISDEAIMGGISKVRENTGLSSRIELLQENPPLLLDVCHNESAIATLIDTLKSSFSQHEKWDVVFAAMKDKNTARILNLIKPICGKLHLPQLKIDRAETNHRLRQIADTFGFEKIQEYDSVEDLFQQNITALKPVLITGSFYLAGEILPIIKNSLNREKK